MLYVHESNCTFVDLDVDFKCSVGLSRTSHVSWMMDRSSIFMDIRFSSLVSVRCCFFVVVLLFVAFCGEAYEKIHAKPIKLENAIQAKPINWTYRIRQKKEQTNEPPLFGLVLHSLPKKG